MKNINKSIIYFSMVVFVLLLIPSFLAAWAEDEGTLGKNIVWQFFANLFWVLRFPTHTLLWQLIIKGGIITFLGGFVFNGLFYGLLIERIIYGIKYLRKDGVV